MTFKINKMKNNKGLLIFAISLVVRLVYCFLIPNVVKLDEQRYHILSNQIINGSYDLDAISFICAPFIPYCVALIKCISITYWQSLFFIFQCLLTALSVVYLFKLTDLLFKNKQISTIAAWFYCFYPMTFYYVKNIGQECTYQSCLIISVYFLNKFSELKLKRDLIIAAIVFSICFLTKGIILFWSPFIVFFIFRIKSINLKEKINNSIVFSAICLLFTIPNGVYNLQKHKVYTFSSDGLAHYFWFGNSEFAYQRDVLGTINYGNKTTEIKDTAKWIYDMSPPNVSMATYEKAFQLFPSEQARQAIFKRNAFDWIEQNPKRFIELKIHCCIRFFLCGLNYKIYPLSKWALSVAIFLPLYAFAYVGLFKSLKTDFEKHNWMLTLFIIMCLFSMVYTFESRFRTTTLEPFYIIYAVFAVHGFTHSSRRTQSFLSFFSL